MSKSKIDHWAKELFKKLFKKAAKKAYLPDMVSGKNPNPEQMQKLDDIYKRLKK